MGILRRKAKLTPLLITPQPTGRVEVERHKNATQAAAQKAMKVNEHLKDLYINNGFSLKIYLSAGGKLERKIGGK